MKKIALAFMIAGLSFQAVAGTDPEKDRLDLVKHYKQTLPGIAPSDYIYGSLPLDPGAFEQYKSIMDAPPFEDQLDKGAAIWNKPFKNGKTFASCFPNGGKNVAGNYPYFDDKLNKLVTFDAAINQCLSDNGEAVFKFDDMKTMGLVTAYARTLSDGMKMNIKVKGAGALAAYEQGKSIYTTRRGQMNFACSSCHIDNVGKSIRSELLSPMVGQATHWPLFRAGTNLFTLQKRFYMCNKNVRAEPYAEGGLEYNALEYYLSYMSNGLPLKSAVYRK